MLRALRLALFGTALLIATGASAAPIEFRFSGFVTDDAINGCGGMVACAAVTGSFTFDSLAVDTNAQAAAGLYAAAGISLYVDGTLFFSAGSGSINVVNGALGDQYGLLGLGGSASNGSTADLSILLEDSTGLAFASDALPAVTDALALMLPGSFTLFATDDAFQLSGSITAIACAAGCDGGGQIPEPATILLLAIGLVSLGLQNRRAPRVR